MPCFWYQQKSSSMLPLMILDVIAGFFPSPCDVVSLCLATNCSLLLRHCKKTWEGRNAASLRVLLLKRQRCFYCGRRRIVCPMSWSITPLCMGCTANWIEDVVDGWAIRRNVDYDWVNKMTFSFLAENLPSMYSSPYQTRYFYRPQVCQWDTLLKRRATKKEALKSECEGMLYSWRNTAAIRKILRDE